jgi:glycosyltransferase involved in cell wall biosynthesis
MKITKEQIRLAIVLPTFNVENSILGVLKEIDKVDKSMVDEVVIVDNASNDKTLVYVKNFLDSNTHFPKSHLIVKTKNEGYGESIKSAIEYLLGNNFNKFIIIHSDDQAEWGKVIGDLLDNRDFKTVLTTRFGRSSDIQHYSLIRKLGNYFFQILTMLVSGKYISDAGAAIGLYSTSTLVNLPWQFLEGGYMFHPQLNLLLHENREKGDIVTYIPICWKDSSEKKKFPYIKYSIKLTYLLGYYFINVKVLKKNSFVVLKNFNKF